MPVYHCYFLLCFYQEKSVLEQGHIMSNVDREILDAEKSIEVLIVIDFYYNIVYIVIYFEKNFVYNLVLNLYCT